MPRLKDEIITFKVDVALRDAMRAIPNRSEFIRSAILGALDSVCPLCSGTGILTPARKTHLQEFLGEHSLQECEECHEVRLVCARPARRRARQTPGATQGGKP